MFKHKNRHTVITLKMMKKKQKNLLLVKQDKWLKPYENTINQRHKSVVKLQQKLHKAYGSLYDFAGAYKYLGINYDVEKKGWYYREWAPEAYALYLIGDFNNWDRNSHPLKKSDNGIWEIFLDEKDYKNSFVHKSRVKVLVESKMGRSDRLPAYITRVVQDKDSRDFSGQLWFSKQFDWSEDTFEVSGLKSLFIYECHIGMGQEKEGLGTYREFADNILPHIKELGYNVIQTMAIQEHPYYGSFGYHVSNFFAPSSKFGTPEDLKYLIKKAHSMGIAVIMDIIHSHAIKNLLEGLNGFDGTEYQYFHEKEKGHHPDWDSRLFNYGKREVIQFLLSNIRYWLEEFHFDGFRFDGVTSMLYHHHGNIDFGHLDKYFDESVNEQALTYLQLANILMKEIKPGVISIAEDVSGMPGLCRPVKEGGIGFKYRLAMGLPDYWIKLLKEKRDEDFNVHDMWYVLNNRRYREKNIAYCESHDQALVGDKTIAFRLMDKEMYYHMRKDDNNMVIDRGIALHKMIRLFTISTGGEAYLNFMGNEFGHPEWIDFPREGNDWSYKYARRQWSLLHNQDLKFQFLNSFDREMIELIKKYKILSASKNHVLKMDEENQVITFEKGKLIFLFNFNPLQSFVNYKFDAPKQGNYKIILNSDSKQFGGHKRIDESVIYPTSKKGKLKLYITNRTTLVLTKVNTITSEKNNPA